MTILNNDKYATITKFTIIGIDISSRSISVDT